MIGLDRAGRGGRHVDCQDEHRPLARLPRALGPHLARAAVAGCAALGISGSALAAAASAATVTADKACYVDTGTAAGTPMTITGAGFGAGDSIEISGGTVLANGTADSAGSFSITTAAPEFALKYPTQSTVLTVTDTNAANGAQTTTTLMVEAANLEVTTQPTSVKNIAKTKVTYIFSGFTPGKRIYGYYMRKKVVAKSAFGRAAGPCGTLTQKALLFPGGHPKNDQYKVTFESSSRYVKTIFPRVVGTLNILKF